MILHVKHYAHAPGYEAMHAIAFREFTLRRFRIEPPRATAEEMHHPPPHSIPGGKTSGYISVVSLEVVTP